MYKAYCDEAKAVFLCLMQKKKSQIRLNLRLLAEMVGFEPTIHLHIHSYIIIAKSRRSVNTFCRRSPQRQRGLLVRDERKPLPPSVGWGTFFFVSAPGSLFHAVLSFPRARL